MRRVFLDSNVWIYSAFSAYKKHQKCADLIRELKRNSKVEVCYSLHGLAEAANIVSKISGSPVLNGATVSSRILVDNIIQQSTIIIPTLDDYRLAISLLERENMKGGILYDCLHMVAAARHGCQQLHTANLRDFRRLEPHFEVEIVEI